MRVAEHRETAGRRSIEGRAARLRVALSGNPNCGKSSVFNALTGAHQHVANYAGVTVEKRVGTCLVEGLGAEIIDLPGTYSLSAFSPEERVAEAELRMGHDVVVVVVDSTQLRRSLVLLAQIMQTGANLVLCLNMADEARAAGQTLDLTQLEQLLGFPVVETVAHRKQGLAALRAAIVRAAHAPVFEHRLLLGEDLEGALSAIRAVHRTDSSPRPGDDWTAVQCLLGHSTGPTAVSEAEREGAGLLEAQRQRNLLEALSGQDIAVFVAGRYSGFVERLLRKVQTQPPRVDARLLTDRIDTLVAHPILGLPIFALVMFGIFWLTFSVGEYPMTWTETGTRWVGEIVSSWWPAQSTSTLRSLLVDGIIAGVGGVVVFLPNIALLFLGLAFLEDTGYLARAAFLTDRVMHRFGLHGKSFIPMVTGLGCTVPGVMATRTLENERDRLTTMLVLPLISCGARLPIWLLLIPAFFAPAWRAPMLWLIYALGIGLALGLALLLRRTVLRGDDAPFVMELPPYRLPTMRSVLLKVAQRAGLYLSKAGTTILAISILLWAATTFPRRDTFRVDEQLRSGALRLAASDSASQAGGSPSAGGPSVTEGEVAARRAAEGLEFSIAGRLGRALEPVFAPLGFDWRLVTAMFGALAAKEVFVAQLGIVYSIAGNEDGTEALRRQLARDYSPLVGLSLMVFLLVSSPCMATVAVTRRESGRWRWALLQLGGLTGLAYGLSLIVFQVGRFIS